MGGEQRARAAEQAGQIWGNFAQNIGGIASNALMQHAGQKAEEKQQAGLKARDAAALDFVSKWDGSDPKALFTGLAQIGGPEYAKKYGETALAFHSKPTEDPKEELGNFWTAGKAIEELPEEIRPHAYDQLKTRFGPMLVKKGVLDPQMLEAPYSPETGKALGAVTNAIGQRLGFKQEKEQGPLITKPGDIARDPKTGAVLFENPQAPEKEKKPAAGTFGSYLVGMYPEGATPAQELAARREYEAAGRAPREVKAPEELTLNPEGVVLSSYGKADKNAARKQAMERGLPVFETAATQEKASKISAIVADAQELNGLLGDAEVQAAIGPFAGKYTQLKGKFFDLPPKVQRAVQLMGSLSDSEMRKRSGASTTEPEFQRLLKFAADPEKPLGHNTTAVRGLLESGARDYKALAGVNPRGAGEAQGKTVVRTGKTKDGKVVLQYSDGTTEVQ